MIYLSRVGSPLWWFITCRHPVDLEPHAGRLEPHTGPATHTGTGGACPRRDRGGL